MTLNYYQGICTSVVLQVLNYELCKVNNLETDPVVAEALLTVLKHFMLSREYVAFVAALQGNDGQLEMDFTSH
jgi:hypothetical protein